MEKSIILILSFLILNSPVFSDGAGTSSVELLQPGFEVDHTRSDPKRSARTHERDYEGPVIDTHAHLYPPNERNATSADIHKEELNDIRRVMRKLDVEFVIFMPTPNDGIRRNQELGVVKRKMIRDIDPDRVKLFCGSNYITCWLDAAYHNKYTEVAVQDILKQLSEDIDSGEYAGVGEVGIYHFDKGYGRQRVLEFPPNFNPFLRIVDLIGEKGMWLDLHAEPVDPKGRSYEKEVFGGIELLFHRNPNMKLIYSHTAMTNPENVRKILNKYPNIMMNVKIETRHEKWKNLEPVVNTRGELYGDWAQLFEEIPDRFMIGTDFHFGRKGVEISKYKKRIKQVRKILGTLDPKTARTIAYENAKRLFVDSL
ncbi:MAG: amidohydrolase family protein [Deltaproteobacteria bacterium]|nr:amidohydrolase family protein [Deltaproteobacteria bacterium]